MMNRSHSILGLIGCVILLYLPNYSDGAPAKMETEEAPCDTSATTFLFDYKTPKTYENATRECSDAGMRLVKVEFYVEYKDYMATFPPQPDGRPIEFWSEGNDAGCHILTFPVSKPRTIECSSTKLMVLCLPPRAECIFKRAVQAGRPQTTSPVVQPLFDIADKPSRPPKKLVFSKSRIPPIQLASTPNLENLTQAETFIASNLANSIFGDDKRHRNAEAMKREKDSEQRSIIFIIITIVVVLVSTALLTGCILLLLHLASTQKCKTRYMGRKSITVACNNIEREMIGPSKVKSPKRYSVEHKGLLIEDDNYSGSHKFISGVTESYNLSWPHQTQISRMPYIDETMDDFTCIFPSKTEGASPTTEHKPVERRATMLVLTSTSDISTTSTSSVVVHNDSSGNERNSPGKNGERAEGDRRLSGGDENGSGVSSSSPNQGDSGLESNVPSPPPSSDTHNVSKPKSKTSSHTQQASALLVNLASDSDATS